MNIFEISAEYLRLMQEIEDLEGEITEDIEERLHINRNEMKSKLDVYRGIIVQYKANIASIEDEVKRLNNKKKTITNIIERLEENIKQAVEKYADNTTKSGNKTFSTEFCKFTVIKTHPVVVEPTLQLTLEDEALKPFLRGSLIINDTAFTIEDAVKVLKENNIGFKMELAVDKKLIKPVLEEHNLYSDAQQQLDLQFVDEVDKELIESNILDESEKAPIEKQYFDGKIYIDNKASWVKMT